MKSVFFVLLFAILSSAVSRAGGIEHSCESDSSEYLKSYLHFLLTDPKQKNKIIDGIIRRAGKAAKIEIKLDDIEDINYVVSQGGAPDGFAPEGWRNPKSALLIERDAKSFPDSPKYKGLRIYVNGEELSFRISLVDYRICNDKENLVPQIEFNIMLGPYWGGLFNVDTREVIEPDFVWSFCGNEIGERSHRSDEFDLDLTQIFIGSTNITDRQFVAINAWADAPAIERRPMLWFDNCKKESDQTLRCSTKAHELLVQIEKGANSEYPRSVTLDFYAKDTFGRLFPFEVPMPRLKTFWNYLPPNRLTLACKQY